VKELLVYLAGSIALVGVGFILGMEWYRHLYKEYIPRAQNFKYMDWVANKNQTKRDTSWDEWYLILQRYADASGMGSEAITGAGPECWRESYDDECSVADAFIEGFRE